MSSDPNGVRWSTSDRNVGKKLLMQSGWEEGGGLGKHKDGTVSHVKVTKKDNVLGIGYESGVQQVWSTQSVLFADVLKRINGQPTPDDSDEENSTTGAGKGPAPCNPLSAKGKLPVLFVDDSDVGEDTGDLASNSSPSNSAVSSPTSRGPTGSRHSKMYAKRILRKTEALQSEEGRNEVLGAASSSRLAKRTRTSEGSSDDDSAVASMADASSTLKSLVLRRLTVRYPKHEPKPSDDSATVLVSKPEPRPPRCTETPFLA